MPTFEAWDEKCGGCGAENDPESIEDGTPHYRLVCYECGYEGCHECMPLGRSSRCPDCVDPETGE
jgi:hypothetical protein